MASGWSRGASAGELLKAHPEKKISCQQTRQLLGDYHPAVSSRALFAPTLSDMAGVSRVSYT